MAAITFQSLAGQRLPPVPRRAGGTLALPQPFGRYGSLRPFRMVSPVSGAVIARSPAKQPGPSLYPRLLPISPHVVAQTAAPGPEIVTAAATREQLVADIQTGTAEQVASRCSRCVPVQRQAPTPVVVAAPQARHASVAGPASEPPKVAPRQVGWLAALGYLLLR